MIKGIIFDTLYEAKAWDYDNNNFNGSITMYKYSCVPLTATTNVTKEQYSQLNNISQTKYNADGDIIENPLYNALDNSYTLQKYALIVNDDFDVYNAETESYNTPANVVDITNLIQDIQ